MRRLFACLFLIGLSVSIPAWSETPAILGAKAYRSTPDPKGLVEFAEGLGLNALFVGDELANSVPFREECRAAGLKYFLIVRTYNDPEAAGQDPTLVSVDRKGRPARRDEDVMICPSRLDFRRHKMERIRTAIQRLAPDGVTLDYFRFFIYWEGVDPKTGPVNFPAYCFDRSCLEDFVRSSRLRLQHAPVRESFAANQELIEEIWNEHRDAWYEWRVRRIVENGREFTAFIRKEFPRLPIVLHVVPWAREEFGGARQKIVGQDLRRLAPFFDYVSPMEYSALTRRGSRWVERLNQALLAEVPARKLLPSIEVGPDGPEFPPMPPAHYEGDLKAARKVGAGVVLYHLELLLDDPVKQAITRRVMAP